MKTLLSCITFSVVLLSLQPSVAFAQGRRPPGMGGGGGGNEMFTAVDSNGDGALDAAELANAAAALKKLDKNGDGSITKDEVAPSGGFGMGGRGGMAPGAATPGTTTPGSTPPAAPMSGMGKGKGKGKGKGGHGMAPSTPNPDETVKTLMQFDKNADGKLSKDEVPERMQGIFENNDANKDGLLSPDEIKAAAAAPAGGAGAAGGRPR